MTNKETITYGLYGWFWKTSTGKYAVVITNHNLLNEHFNHNLEYKYPPFSEDIRYFTPAEFYSYRIVRKLKVPKDPKVQKELEIAHNQKHSSSLKNALVGTGNHKGITGKNQLAAPTPLRTKFACKNPVKSRKLA